MRDRGGWRGWRGVSGRLRRCQRRRRGGGGAPGGSGGQQRWPVPPSPGPTAGWPAPGAPARRRSGPAGSAATAATSASRSATSRATSARTGGSTQAAVTRANSAASVIQSSTPQISSTSTRRRVESAHGSSVRWCSRPRHAQTCTQRTQSDGSWPASAGPSRSAGAAGGCTSRPSRSARSRVARPTAASYAAGGCGHAGWARCRIRSTAADGRRQRGRGDRVRRSATTAARPAGARAGRGRGRRRPRPQPGPAVETPSARALGGSAARQAYGPPGPGRRRSAPGAGRRPPPAGGGDLARARADRGSTRPGRRARGVSSGWSRTKSASATRWAEVAVAQVPQPVRGVHGAVERRVAGQRPVDPVQGLVEPAVVGQGAGDVRVDGEVVGVVLDGPAEGREGLAGPARRCGRRTRARPRPASTAGAYPRVAQSTASVDLAEPAGQRGRRAEQQAVLGVRGDRVAGEREVRAQRRPADLAAPGRALRRRPA